MSDGRSVVVELVEAAQAVSDETAKLEQIQLPDSAGKGRLKGYIWIGDFKQTWNKPMLAQANTGQSVCHFVRRTIHQCDELIFKPHLSAHKISDTSATLSAYG